MEPQSYSNKGIQLKKPDYSTSWEASLCGGAGETLYDNGGLRVSALDSQLAAGKRASERGGSYMMQLILSGCSTTYDR